jgi:transcriptional regulator with XRE-family HTH domain
MNVKLITERRIAAGLTVRQLADQLGLRAAVLRRLEDDFPNDAEGARLSVATLSRICAGLDLDVSEVLGGEKPAACPAADDIKLEAALVEHGGVLSRDDLALALGWPLTRLERALLTLEQRLRPTGQRLRRVGWNSYTLRPSLRALGAKERQELHRAQSGRAALKPAVAFILLGVINGAGREWWLDRLPAADRNGVELLLRQGLIEHTDRGHLAPTADVIYSLHLEHWQPTDDDDEQVAGETEPSAERSVSSSAITRLSRFP